MYDLMTPIALKTNWMNLTNVNNLLASLVYDTNQTSYLQGIEQGYQIDYNEASMAWLPVSDLYLLVQPYVHGLVFSLVRNGLRAGPVQHAVLQRRQLTASNKN